MGGRICAGTGVGTSGNCGERRELDNLELEHPNQPAQRNPSVKKKKPVRYEEK